MNKLLFSTLIGLGVGGVGIGLGGFAAYAIGRRADKIIGLLFAGCSGMIITVLGLELLPESIATGGIIPTLIGILIGILVIARIEHFFHRIVIITDNPRRSQFIRSGILLTLGVAIHNFPVGFAMGAGLTNDSEIGLDLATIMLFHNLPEGFAISLPLIFGGLGGSIIPIIAAIVSLPAGLGALFGSSFQRVNPALLSSLFGIAIGTILFVSWHELLLPSLKMTRKPGFIISLCVGAFSGIVFTIFL